jgi:Holliday junction resolvase RusA-like endonuclease
MKILIKPLSVNKAFQGRRFKTNDYKLYEKELSYLLPKRTIDKTSKLQLIIEVGYANKMSDIDNFVKPFQDVLQKKYNFNDHQIYRLNVHKVIVKKGEEYINFELINL